MKYLELEKHIDTIYQINNLIKIANWDYATMMPIKAAANRSSEIATIASISHEMFISERTAGLIAQSENEQLDEWQQNNLREIKRVFIGSSCISKDLMHKYTKICNECEFNWRQARSKNDYMAIKPLLQKVLDYTKEIASIKASKFNISIYDALLDSYNTGMNADKLKPMYDELKQKIPLLLTKILEKQPSLIEFPDKFDIKKQKELGIKIMKNMGFDFEAGRLDESTHPFCTSSPKDIRLTTRYKEDNFIPGVMAIIHETGHALYEMNLPEKYRNQPVGQARNMSIHESQSLIMEKQAASSKEFMEFFAKELRDTFGYKGKAYSSENIYNSITHVEPSFIRVDADEVTYIMHVIMRFEIEQALISGDLMLDDLPEVWNTKIEQYLGIKPKNDIEGCLQDIHWFSGAFGYFPAYANGAIIASMLMTKVKSTFPEISKEVNQGSFNSLNLFLNKNLRGFGSLKLTDELIKVSTGYDNIESKVFIDYVQKKFL